MRASLVSFFEPLVLRRVTQSGCTGGAAINECCCRKSVAQHFRYQWVATDLRHASLLRAAYTIPEFGRAYSISVRTYFNMRDEGLGPREMGVGRAVRISRRR